MVETAQQARDIVSWTRYPPRGRRGDVLGAAHDDYSGGGMKEKFALANERCFLMLQVETEVGVENVEEIATVADVDCICIGYADLSNFLGVPGELKHPKYLRCGQADCRGGKQAWKSPCHCRTGREFRKGICRAGLQDVLLRHRCAPAAIGTRPADHRDAGRRALKACR
jgi:2-dehydro-3-deoxyglucarate aldolase/4-hydroxy-2-oxoheptanedioate aldolase